jgi:hypothetical protein
VPLTPSHYGYHSQIDITTLCHALTLTCGTHAYNNKKPLMGKARDRSLKQYILLVVYDILLCRLSALGIRSGCNLPCLRCFEPYHHVRHVPYYQHLKASKTQIFGIWR